MEPIEFMQSRLAVLSHLISTSEHYLKDPLTLHLQAVKFLLSSSAGADESTEGTIPSSRKLTFVCDKEAFYKLDEDGFYVFDPYSASITFSHKVIDIRIRPTLSNGRRGVKVSVKFRQFLPRDECELVINFINNNTKKQFSTTVNNVDSQKFTKIWTNTNLRNEGILGTNRSGQKILKISIAVTRCHSPYDEEERIRRKVDVSREINLLESRVEKTLTGPPNINSATYPIQEKIRKKLYDLRRRSATAFNSPHTSDS